MKSGDVEPTNHWAYLEMRGKRGKELFIMAWEECNARQFEFEWKNRTGFPKLRKLCIPKGPRRQLEFRLSFLSMSLFIDNPVLIPNVI